MEQQGLSEGSLRNSHRETHAVRRKPAPAAFQELACNLVERCSNDLILRQRCDVTNAAGLLKRGVFYVMENEGRADPGWLVFLPGKPVMYVQSRRGGGRGGNGPTLQAWTLRMRVSPAVAEGGGTVLVATLDDVLHTLRLEDVWCWRGDVMTGESYSRRRQQLKEFVEHYWVPDARLLGGIYTSVANPISMEEFAGRDELTCASIEFIPEMAGKRRMWHAVGAPGPAPAPPVAMPARPAAAAAAVEARVQKPAAPAAPAPAAPAPASVPMPERRARAVPVGSLPDVYDLFAEDGLPISRASVQQFALSQQLRKAVAAAPEGVWVRARWRPEFGGYEIAAIN
jgi:hypothetical protein